MIVVMRTARFGVSGSPARSRTLAGSSARSIEIAPLRAAADGRGRAQGQERGKTGGRDRGPGSGVRHHSLGWLRLGSKSRPRESESGGHGGGRACNPSLGGAGRRGRGPALRESTHDEREEQRAKGQARAQSQSIEVRAGVTLLPFPQGRCGGLGFGSNPRNWTFGHPGHSARAPRPLVLGPSWRRQ